MKLFNLFSSSLLLAVANGQWDNSNNNNNNWQTPGDTTNNGWGQNNGWDPERPVTTSPTNNPTWPPTWPPTKAPVAPPPPPPLQGLTSLALEGPLVGTTLDYVVNQNDPRAGGQNTVTMRYTVNKLSWIAIAVSTNGQMVGSEAIIGLPDSGTVLKYNMNAKAGTGIEAMPQNQQTLIETSLSQVGGETVMTFTKIMDEAGEIPVVLGSNTLLGAYGFDNALGYHERRAPFALELGDATPGVEPRPVVEEPPAEEIVVLQAGGLVSINLEGLLEGTTLDYVVNLGDARAGGQDTVTISYSVPKESWIAIGFSPNGQMVGSEAVIGLPDAGSVLKYGMSAQLNAGVQPLPDNQQTLIETSITQVGGETVLTFTKILDEAGEIPIVLGTNTLLGAYGFDNSLNFHESRGSFSVDFLAGENQEAGVIETRKKTLWQAHGICAALAWGLFSPLAIGAAVLRYWLPNGLWFKIHQALNLTVIILTVFAFAFAVAAIQTEQLSHFSPSPNPHKLIGLIVVILAVGQTFGGLFRPHATEPGETKTSSRKGFEIGHRSLGFILLLMAWYQVASGIGIFQRIFADAVGKPYSAVFWGIAWSIVGIVVIGRVFAMVAAKKEKTEESSSVPTSV